MTLCSFGLWPARLLCHWDLSGKNTGEGCHFLLQGVFLTQGLNPQLLCLLHCRQILYRLSHWGSPWVNMRTEKKKKMVRTEKLQLSTCRLSKQWVNSQDWSHIRMADNCLLGTEIRKVLKNTSSVLFFWLFKKLKYLFSCTGSQLSHVGSSVATWKFLVEACRI